MVRSITNRGKHLWIQDCYMRFLCIHNDTVVASVFQEDKHAPFEVTIHRDHFEIKLKEETFQHPHEAIDRAEEILSGKAKLPHLQDLLR
jgi:hypothetical protein